MATKNDITGDALVSKPTTDNYRDNYDRIFGSTKRLQHVQAPCAGQEYLGCTEQVLGLPVSKLQHEDLSTLLGEGYEPRRSL